MKKLVCVALVLTMICGFALASPQDELSDLLGMDYIKMGGISIIDSAFETGDMPFKTMFVLCADKGWYIEYRDNIGQYFGWNGLELNTTENEATMAFIIGAMFETNYINNGVMMASDGTVYALTETGVGDEENYFNNVEDFILAVAG